MRYAGGLGTLWIASCLACAPALSVSVSCTVTLPAALVASVAVGPVVLPLKAAMVLPLVRLHW